MLEPEQEGVDAVKFYGVRSPHADSQRYHNALKKLPAVLKLLGYSGLRPGQDRAVHNLFMCRDTVVFLPTGQGKSAIYVIPTLCMDLRCVIFSPLISLMKDQLEGLWKWDLTANQISSGQSQAENDAAMRAWEADELQFLFVAPERMDNETFMKAMRRCKPSFIVIDESHALSEWGDNFRPAYLNIGKFIAEFQPDLVLALTATATPDVEKDIRRVLRIPEANKVVYYPSRKNLQLSSMRMEGDHDVKYAIDQIEGSVIVYCPTRKQCEALYNKYADRIKDGALVYHGGMDDGTKTANQDLFMANRIRVMFATNAFGLGVNKPDIRGVIHCGYSKSMEAGIQESGRAGRDGKPATCILLYDDHSYETNRYLIDTNHAPEEMIRSVFAYIKTHHKNGIIRETGDAIASALGYNMNEKGKVSAALTELVKAGLISRSKEEEKIGSVKIMKSHVDSSYQNFMDRIGMLGNMNADGYYDIQVSFLVSDTKLKEAKVKTMLKDLDKNGYIVYRKPFNGKTTTFIGGDVNKIDFDSLESRRRDSFGKLEALRRYAMTPDAEKHDYILDYLKVR